MEYSDKQEYITIDRAELKNRSAEMKGKGFMLSQITASKKEQYDILYTFEKNYEMINLRVLANDEDEVESLSDMFLNAFIYENEMKDLFGIKVVNLNLDFKGNLYRTKIPHPFNTPAAATAAAPKGKE